MTNVKQVRQLAKGQFAEIYARLVGAEYSAEITASHISLWHSDFDESDMCFVIEAEVFSDSQASFSAYLYPHDKNRKLECAKALEEVLGVEGGVLDDESMEDTEWYIMLKEYEEVEIDGSLAQKFGAYFDKLKDKVYAFNQAIQEDLLKENGSKLEGFIDA